MRLDPNRCPECGDVARGTLETVTGVAEFTLAADRSVEYTGYTDIWWDELKTVVDEGGGYVRLVCPNGHDWAARSNEDPSRVQGADDTCLSCEGWGWLHMNDSMGCGPGIEKCDSCARFPYDEDAAAAHATACACGLGMRAAAEECSGGALDEDGHDHRRPA